MYEFRLPDIGEGLSEAELLEWHVKVGDDVKEGGDVASVSTDKVNVELPSPRSGKVVELCWKPGDIIPVGNVLMRLAVETGGATKTADSQNEKAQAGDARAARATAQRPQPGARVKASPAVRKKAKEHGVDLTLVAPTGSNGFILPQDIDNYLKSGGAAADADSRLVLRGAKLTAAEKLSRSHARQVTTTIAFEVNADAITATVDRLSQSAKQQHIKATPLAVIAKCAAEALSRHPQFNGVIHEDEKALSVSKTVEMGIAGAIAEIVAKTRAGDLKTGDVARPTFTLSSTGGFERAAITSTTPVINYPNVATLWASRISERPRVIDGRLDVGPVLYCSLSFDHRFLNGAEAIEFINALNEFFMSANDFTRA